MQAKIIIVEIYMSKSTFETVLQRLFAVGDDTQALKGATGQAVRTDEGADAAHAEAEIHILGLSHFTGKFLNRPDRIPSQFHFTPSFAGGILTDRRRGDSQHSRDIFLGEAHPGQFLHQACPYAGENIPDSQFTW